MRTILLSALLLLVSACSEKDGPACEVPADLPRPMLEGATSDQPKRILPIGGYTLAVSWTPEYCVNRMSSPQDRIRCGAAKPFGFTLHGLWPDGEGALWPQFCTPARLVPDKDIRDHLCASPSPQLIQHEWEKHGTCMSKTPADYLAKSRSLYQELRYPEMEKLHGQTIRAADFQKLFADANPGMAPDQMRLEVGKTGWLEEVWICLDEGFHRRTCPAHQGGALPEQIVKIR